MLCVKEKQQFLRHDKSVLEVFLQWLVVAAKDENLD